MRFPGKEVIKAYVTALNGNISYGGNNVPVWSRVAASGTNKTQLDSGGNPIPYILVSDFTSTTDTAGTCKDTWGHNTTTLFEIVTRFNSGKHGGFFPSQDIADKIVQLVGEGITIENIFYDVIPDVDSYNTLTEQNQKYLTIRGLLRMRNQIKES